MKAKKEELYILMSNALVESRFEYTEVQLDILFYTLAQLRKDEDNKPILTYDLYISDLENLRGGTIRTYSLQQTMDAMGGKPLKVRSADMEDAEDWHSIFLFAHHKYTKKSRILRVKLTDDVIPFLFDLKKQFTSVELYSLLRMTSKHAKRIYQICCQWKKGSGEKMFYIDELKELLGCEKEYKQIVQFRQYVLDIAKKQINEHSDIRIDFRIEKRQSRTYNVVYFSIKEQKTRQAPIDFQYNEREARAQMNLKSIGIVDKKLVHQIVTEKLGEFNQWFHAYQTGKHGKVANAAGHCLVVLGLRDIKPKTLKEKKE